MGGEPIMAIAILGWPINTIPGEVARLVLDGSRIVCKEAGIPLAGGHSIDCPEPVFGLAVTGKLKKEHLKRNDTAKAGSSLYLTKPLGIGMITTAQKKGIVKEEHLKRAIDTMITLNKAGADFGKMKYVTALTDVTGFGLLGHLTEMCEGSGLSARIDSAKVPKFEFLQEYIQQKSTPGGTQRNWDSYGSKISPISPELRAVLADPQTSGGLLVAVEDGHTAGFESYVQSKFGWRLEPFGTLTARSEHIVTVD
jgi:selenide,water dikinase